MDPRVLNNPSPDEAKKWTFKNFIVLIGLVILVISVPVGVFLVQRQQLLNSQAFNQKPELIKKITGFFLKPDTTQATNSGQIPVGVYVRSDSQSAGRFVVKLNFPPELLQLNSIQTQPQPKKNQDQICKPITTRACQESAPQNCKDFLSFCDVPNGWIIDDSLIYFIKDWKQQSFNNEPGLVYLEGLAPSPGFFTKQGEQGLLATLNFSVKFNKGNAQISFDEGTGIFDTIRDQNILEASNSANIDLSTFPAPSIAKPSSSPKAKKTS